MNKNKLNIVVLFGGKSTEHDVSCMSAYNILNAIDKTKYEISIIGITKDGEWLYFDGDISSVRDGDWEDFTVPAGITPNDGFFKTVDEKSIRIPCDVAVPAMHGGYCEDGRLQGMFDMCGIKYVGPGCTSSALCMDKFYTKLTASYIGVPIADFYLADRYGFSSDQDHIISDICGKFEFPVFVKPSNAGSSVGVSKVSRRDELADAIASALKYDRCALIEECVTGAEIEVAVMGNDAPIASVCGEINPGADFYDYETKYENDTASYYIPARLDEKTSENVRKTALDVYKILGCRGLSRVDFFVDGDKIVFNEINTLPGFTSISMYPSLFKHAGLTYSEIIDKLIGFALES